MIDMMTKRSALHTLCRDTLQVHRSGLRSDVTYRGADEPSVSRADRVKVMGDPIWYMEILHTRGPLLSPSQGASVSGGKMHLSVDVFRVSVWYEQKHDGSSQSTFDDMMYSQTEGEEGLIYKLTQTLTIGGSVRFSQPLEPVQDVIWMGSDQARAHFATFTIEIEG